MTFLFVALGGALGACGRYAISVNNILTAKNYGLCGLYVALSVAGCIAGVWCGKKHPKSSLPNG